MMVARPGQSRLGPWLKAQVNRDSPMRRVAWGFAFFLGLMVLFSLTLTPEHYDLKVGQVAPKDIKATRSVVDRYETQRLQKQAEQEVNDVYEQDPEVAEAVAAEVGGLFAAIRQFREEADGGGGGGGQPPAGSAPAGEAPDASARRKQALEQLQGLPALAGVQDAELELLLDLSEEDLSRLEQAARDILLRVMQAGIKAEALPTFRRQVEIEAQAAGLQGAERNLVQAVGKNLLRPNMLFNREETLKRRRRAVEAVEPVRILEGETIVEEGQRVTERHLAILRDLGLERSQSDVRGVAGSCLLSALLVGLGAAYLVQFAPEVAARESLILLTGLIVLLTLVLGAVLYPISGYLAPVAAGSMLLAILVNPRVALFLAALMALGVGVVSGWDLRFPLVAMCGATVGVFRVARVGQRSDLVRDGLLVGAVNALAVVMLTLLPGAAPLSQPSAWKDVVWGASSGVFSAVLTIGSLPFFERYFGLITPLKLLELCNPNQPLLKRLLVEAPGTYHHCVVVANLAESGTEAIGGNSLLARAGAYYHDVGKLRRPYFFIENQFAGDNPHDKISPSLSLLILTSHVRDGLELGRNARLPAAVLDFIQEHHGTTLVSYFYSRAAEEGQEPVPEDAFRYEGPRPSSRESALVMLADSCEAAVRSLGKPNPGRIEAVVRRIIQDRLTDHQLDRCDLTLRDLDTIADVFARVLTGVFHPRIEYPDSVLKEMQKREARRAVEERPRGGGARAGEQGEGQEGEG
ncbi:MAG: HDIG domain-containing protein [Acetobacteraceae bacterium]|nr:HDIG domain-containing protein [Acetobacteraceae bacterium]